MIIEKKIEKRNGQWCVVHCSGADAGKIIKCYPGTKDGYQRALAMHRAIQASKFKSLDVEETIDLLQKSIECEDYELFYESLFDISRRKLEGSVEFVLNPEAFGEVGYSMWKKTRNKLGTKTIASLVLTLSEYTKLKKLIDKSIELNSTSVIDVIKSIEEENILGSSKVLSKEAYQKILDNDDFINQPLPDEYYANPRSGNFIVQLHVEGISPEQYKKYIEEEMSLLDILPDHDMHVDWRAEVDKDQLMQFIPITKSVDSYIDFMKGLKDPRTKSVMRCIAITNPLEDIKHTLTLSKSDVAKLYRYIDKKTSYWIPPGHVGSKGNTYSYMGTLANGRWKSGVSRLDFKETFLYSDSKLFNGRWIWKAIDSPNKMWVSFKADKTPYPANPYYEIDKGIYEVKPASELELFSKEDYPEWSRLV